jgi:hypothetical protein
MPQVHTAHATWTLAVSLVSQNQAGNYSTLRVTFYANADSGWGSGTFANGIGFSATGYGNGSYNLSGTSLVVCDFYYNVWHDANGYCNWSVAVHSNATGTSTYGGPVDLSDGGSLPRIPKVPTAPAIVVNQPVGLSVQISVNVPAGFDEGGSSVQYLWSEYSKDGGAWTGGAALGWGARTFNNLAPGVYQFRALAHNAIGDGPLVYSGTVTVRSGGKVWNGTAWVPGVAKVWNGSAWVPASVKVWNGTAWVPAL